MEIYAAATLGRRVGGIFHGNYEIMLMDGFYNPLNRITNRTQTAASPSQFESGSWLGWMDGSVLVAVDIELGNAKHSFLFQFASGNSVFPAEKLSECLKLFH